MQPAQRNSTQLFFALLLIGCGALFFLINITNWSVFTILWPFLIIVPGAVLIYAASQQDFLAGLAIPGAITITVGLILLYGAITGHWEVWAYAWSLLLAALGWGLMYLDRQMKIGGPLEAVGKAFIWLSAVMFVGCGAFFEILIFNDDNPLVSLLLPLLLVAVGIWLLVMNSNVDLPLGGKRVKAKRKNDEMSSGPGIYG